MGFLEILYSIGKWLLWAVAIYGGAKFCDTFIFPLCNPGRSLEIMENDLKRHYELNAKLLEEHGIPEDAYLQLELDDETRVFLKKCQTLQSKYFAFLGQSIVYTYLKPFVTLTSLHALLNRGSMFVLSSDHLATLLPRRKEDEQLRI